MAQFVLYDIPSKGQCRCWSFNVWKTRLALNYKGVDYRTEFVEYPDIASRWIELGLEPNPQATDETDKYTVPMAKFTDDTFVMNSRLIAAKLEEVYPEPPISLDYPGLTSVFKHGSGLLEATQPFWLPLIPRNVLPPRSAEYFERTRAEWFGMSLGEFEKEKATEERWIEARPHAKALGDMLRANGGPFLMGQTVSFADFVIVGVLHCMKRADLEGKLFDKMLGLDGAFKVLYEACSKWLERDD